MPDAKPLLFRVIPHPLRRAIRRAIRPYVDRLLSEFASASPNLDARHFPINPFGQAYVLPKATRSDPASPDGMPIPPRDLWWDYAATAEKYLAIGRGNVTRMRVILRRHGRDLKPGDRVLDFGCAAGPQTRCLADLARGDAAAKGGEVWGVDISAACIQWCVHHLPEELRFATTSTMPHLPFEDRYFDAVFCGSVFSHIGELAEAWLLELARIVRPGGTVYLTMNTKKSMLRYLKDMPDLEFSRRVEALLTPEQIASDFSAAEVGRGIWLHSVFDIATFKRKCAMMFHVVDVVRNAYSFQIGLVLDRKETGRR